MDEQRPLVINFCPTGMIPTKEMTPHVPISVAEIVEEVHECYEIGITIAHLHARDDDGVPTWSKNIYRDIFEGVRKHCPDLIICGSTSGRNFPEFEKRSAVIELKPDMCSLTLSSMNFVNQASINEPQMILKLLSKMNDHGVHPELECFDLGMINYGNFLINKGLVKGPHYFNLIFGNIAGMQPTEAHFKAAVSSVPEHSWIGIGGIGKFQFDSINWAIENNFGVRIGLEDNIWLDKEKGSFCTNLDQIKTVHNIIRNKGKNWCGAPVLRSFGFSNRN